MSNASKERSCCGPSRLCGGGVGDGQTFGGAGPGPADTGASAMPDPMTKAEQAYREDLEAQVRGERAGQIAVFCCPHCGGVLRQTGETRLAEFVCHVGHSYEGEALFSAIADNIEFMSWSLARG